MLITFGEAARRWKITVSALHLARQRGELPARKSAGTWLCEEEDVRAVFGEENPPEGWMTIPEAARRAGISRAAVYSKVKRGIIPAVKAQRVLWVPGAYPGD